MRHVRSMMGCVVALAALSVASGCSQAEIKINCAPSINNFGMPADSPGSALKIVLLTLNEDDFRKLNQSESLFGKLEKKKVDNPSGSITAKKWFYDGLNVEVKAIVPEDAIVEVTVGPGTQVAVPLNSPGGMFGRGGILALARFSGMDADNKAKRFQSQAWLPRGRQGNAVLKVEETSIRWNK